MTDPSPWASPSGEPTGPGATPFGAPATPPPAPPPVTPPAAPVAPVAPPSPYGPPPGSSWGPPPGQPGQPVQPGVAPGWTPPPKPGLIPLRPLTLGPLLGASFQVMRRNPKPTFGISLLLSGAVSVLAALITGLVLVLTVQRIQNAAPGDIDQIASGSVGIALLAALIPVGIGFAAFAILQGVISLEVARGTVGEKLRLRGLLRLARGRMGALVGWAALLLAGITIGSLVLILIIVGLAVALGPAGIAVGVLLGVVGGLGMVVLACWLGAKTSLVPSVLVLERLPLRDAIVRSWRLTNGFFWRTFGIELLVLVIISFATGIVTQPVGFIGGLLATLTNPLEDPAAYFTTLGVVYLITVIVSLIANSIGLIVQSAAATLIYIDLRMRKEGLDVELVRFVEAKQAGDTTVPDPYLPRGATPAAAAAPDSPWS